MSCRHDRRTFLSVQSLDARFVPATLAPSPAPFQLISSHIAELRSAASASVPGAATPVVDPAVGARVATRGVRLLRSVTFDATTWWRWVTPNPNALVGRVTRAGGAVTQDGAGALRWQLGRDVYDPLLKRRSADSVDARIAGIGLDLVGPGVGRKFALRYFVRFDRDSHMDDPGMKLNWFWGTRSTPGTPDELNWYVKLDPNYDTFSLINNSPTGVGEDFTGYDDLRRRGMSARLSDSPGAAALLQGRTAQEFFTSGRYVRVRISIVLNDPGQRNGSFDLWVAGVKVLGARDVEFRDRAADTFSKVDLIGMYGGASAPTSSFGGQVDSVVLWDDRPATWR
jgi:hypothetical protein